MRIQPVVEGEGEVQAIGVLLRRLRNESGAYRLTFNKPISKHRSQFVREQPLRTAVRIALKERGDGILVLFDADKDCPRGLAQRVQGWAQDEAGRVPCEVVIANREYEAWFLGALPSLSAILQGAPAFPDPESIRGAKEKLEKILGSYTPTADQASLTARFDMAAAYRRCRSFRRMVNAFGQLAARMGVPLTDWPPASWQEA